MSSDRNIIDILKDLRDIHESEVLRSGKAAEDTSRNIDALEKEIEEKKKKLEDLRQNLVVKSSKINRIDQLIRILEYNVEQNESSVISCRYKSKIGCARDILQSMVDEDDVQTDVIFTPKQKVADTFANPREWTGFVVPYEYQRRKI